MKLVRYYYDKRVKPRQSGNLLRSRKYLRLVQSLFVAIMLFCMLLVFPFGLVFSRVQQPVKDTDGNINNLSSFPHHQNDNAQLTPDFAQEVPDVNYNYLYNDGSDGNGGNNNYVEGGGDKNNAKQTSEIIPPVTNSNRVTFTKGVSESVKTRRRNKILQNSHYKRRQRLLDSLFISVKTTKAFHSTRLEPVLKTWFNLAREQTWIFTDADDPLLQKRTGGHIINTNCPSTHDRRALCCKMSAEFDAFIHSEKSWFCHVDDDNYVNIPALLDLLEKYDPKEYWYLGKPSLKNPIHFKDPDNKSEDVSFWFGTGGAGFCLSRALALRMSPLASGGKFMKICDRIQLPDDVTVGYVAGHLLSQNLTVIQQFHSHFETMKFINTKNAESEITFSYMGSGENVNALDIKGFFTEQEDPTRFLSLHCLLFPNFSFCPKWRR